MENHTASFYMFITVWETIFTSQVELYLIKLIKKISESNEINKIVIEKIGINTP